jgi:hypothetical protein
VEPVADDEPAVVVHEDDEVYPPVLALQDKREDVRAFEAQIPPDWVVNRTRVPSTNAP